MRLHFVEYAEACVYSLQPGFVISMRLHVVECAAYGCFYSSIKLQSGLVMSMRLHIVECAASGCFLSSIKLQSGGLVP